jgi:hypothetical protein
MFKYREKRKIYGEKRIWRKNFIHSCLQISFQITTYISRQQNTQLVARILLSLIVSSTLKMEAVYSSEMSMNFYRTTWRHMRQYSTLYGNNIC